MLEPIYFGLPTERTIGSDALYVSECKTGSGTRESGESMENDFVSPIYVSGPMTGIEDWNFPAFNHWAKRLRNAGYEVYNPAETDNGDTTKPRYYYLRQDVESLSKCKTLFLLPGWEQSAGARLEFEIAKRLDMLIWDSQAGRLEPHNSTLAEELMSTVLVRGKSYGHPYEDFSRTAAFWSIIFGVPVTPEQVGLAMIAMKMSREINKSKRDNRLDIAGYAETLEMIAQKRSEPPNVKDPDSGS